MDSVLIVIPCYNEARRLDRAAFEEFLDTPGSPALLFVDDGSTDGTQAILRDLVASYPERTRLLTLPENKGKAEAVRAGLRSAVGDGAACVGYWDADLATPLSHVPDFVAVLEARPAVDVVMGARVRMMGRRIRRSAVRHYLGRVFASLASLVLRLPVYDTQCGAKMFRSTPVLAGALSEPFRSGWSFDVELLRRLQYGWADPGIDRIVEIPLEEWTDVGGSKVSVVGGARAVVSLLGLLPRRPRGRPGEYR